MPVIKRHIKILTYNTHLFGGSNMEIPAPFLPDPVIFEDDHRASEIAAKLETCGADIVALQEVWAYERQSWFAHRLRSAYPFSYFPRSVLEPLDPRLTSGLVLLSKWPLTDQGFVEFRDLHGDDAWAKKGVVSATAVFDRLPTFPCFANFRAGTSHAGTDMGGETQPNIQQIVEATIHHDSPAIMMGDFNVHRSKYAVMDRIFAASGARDVYRMVHGESLQGSETIDLLNNRLDQTFSPRADPQDRSEGHFDRIDYVYMKGAPLGPVFSALAPDGAYVIRDWKYSSRAKGAGMDLSDHYPVVATFSISVSVPEMTALAAGNQNGGLQVFAVGTDGTLHHNWLDRDGWHGWTPDFDLAPKLQSVFSAGNQNGGLQVFAVGTDGTLHHNWLDSNGWHRWTRDFNAAPKVRSIGAGNQNGGLQVFAVGVDGTLFHNWLDGDGWHGWTRNFDGAPMVQSVATGNQNGGLQVFAIGADGTLLHNWLDDKGWHRWTPNFDGAPKVQSVLCARNQNGGLQVFAVGKDGTLFHNWLDSSGWHGWTADFGGASKVLPMLTAGVQNGGLQVFAIGTDGRLGHNWLDSAGWHGWTSDFKGAPKVKIAFCAGNQNGALQVFAIGQDGTLQFNWLDGDGWHDWTS